MPPSHLGYTSRQSDRATRLLVARHGETEDNAAERWQGWADSPLTARGIGQAQALGRRLVAESLGVAYSSDLGRAVETARLALASHAVELRLTEALRERDVGLFSGLTGYEVQDRYAEALALRRTDGTLDWAPPDGESFRQVLGRTLPALRAIAAEWAGQTAFIVTHGGVIRLLAAYAQGEDWEHVYTRHPSNCGLSEFHWHADGSLSLERFDDSWFLDDMRVPPLRE